MEDDDLPEGLVLREPDEEAAGEPQPVRPRRRRALLWLGVGVLGLALVCAGAGAVAMFGLYHRYDSKVERADILADVPRPTPTPGSAPLNYLVLGTDSLDSEGRPTEGDGRSDTMMIVHIDASRTHALVVSIPRDSYVYIPPAGSWPGGLNKINAAYAFGGAALAARTVYLLTGVAFDGAMVVNLAGVQHMVSVLGGVQVCPPYDVGQPGSSDYLAAGCHDLSPTQTSTLLRERKSVPGGDLGRIYSQQLVLRALVAKVGDTGMLAHPATADRLLIAAAESLTVDRDLDLRATVLALRGIDAGQLGFATVPIVGEITTDAGSSLELDQAADDALFAALRDDTAQQWLAQHPTQLPHW